VLLGSGEAFQCLELYSLIVLVSLKDTINSPDSLQGYDYT